MAKGEYPYEVCITWSLEQDRNDWWDQVCIYAIEEFGLPGHEFVTEATQDYMKFYFKNPEDAMIMRLRWHIL